MERLVQPVRLERLERLERLVHRDEEAGRVLIALSGLGDQKREGTVTSPFFKFVRPIQNVDLLSFRLCEYSMRFRCTDEPEQEARGKPGTGSPVPTGNSDVTLYPLKTENLAPGLEIICSGMMFTKSKSFVAVSRSSSRSSVPG
jgi:hypothetical protein